MVKGYLRKGRCLDNYVRKTFAKFVKGGFIERGGVVLEGEGCLMNCVFLGAATKKRSTL